MYLESDIYYIHYIYITVLVGPPTVEKFNPRLIFHNSDAEPFRRNLLLKCALQPIHCSFLHIIKLVHTGKSLDVMPIESDF